MWPKLANIIYVNLFPLSFPHILQNLINLELLWDISEL